MSYFKQPKKTWPEVTSINEAQELVDCGIVLRWDDVSTLRKNLPHAEHETLVKYFAQRLAERAHHRLSSEIIIESFLIFVSSDPSENVCNYFLEEIFTHPSCEQACKTLLDVSLSNLVCDDEHNDDIYSMAVALICEMGLSLKEAQKVYPDNFTFADKLLEHIDSYLLSVSNFNSFNIRLILLHYFATLEKGQTHKKYVDKIMSRFGQTVFDHIFSLLFNKKSEGVAIQYIFENLPYCLEGDAKTQVIINETFKFFMLKNPERFILFMQTLMAYVSQIEAPNKKDIQETILKHLGALFMVASEVNHRPLGRDLLICIMQHSFEDSKIKMIQQLSSIPRLKPAFKILIQELKTNHKQDAKKVADSIPHFRTNKRGRKPKFSRTEFGMIEQLPHLGAQQVTSIAKAS